MRSEIVLIATKIKNYIMENLTKQDLFDIHVVLTYVTMEDENELEECNIINKKAVYDLIKKIRKIIQQKT
jgi:hypothetical protein